MTKWQMTPEEYAAAEARRAAERNAPDHTDEFGALWRSVKKIGWFPLYPFALWLVLVLVSTNVIPLP